MLLRISHQRLGDSSVVRVEGTLSGTGVGELTRACEAAGGKPIIDLTALLSADEVGIALLRSLRDSGVALRGASPYVLLLLESRETTRRADG